MGTIGTPACMAIWKPPFLKGASLRVGVRVPSGDITTDLPFSRIAVTSGLIASIAPAGSLRSIITTPAISNTLPMTGSFLISFLPMLAMSRRNKLVRMTTSALLWWLNMNIAGRVFHKFSRPLTSSSSPIRAAAASENNDIEKFTPSRAEPVSAVIGKPAAKLGTRLAVAASERANRPTLARPRLLKLAAGHPRCSAICISRLRALSTVGRPTYSSN